MTSDRRPVCHRCAQIKQACDGQIPCSRCTRLSLPCRSRNTASSASSNGAIIADTPLPDADAAAEATPKARIRRVQTGCLMCKQRKKKCDEIKPKCGDCRRLCLDCHWPPERQKELKGQRPGQVKQGAQKKAAQAQVQAGGSPTQPVVIKSESPAEFKPEIVSIISSNNNSNNEIAIRNHSPLMSSPISNTSDSGIVINIPRTAEIGKKYAQPGAAWETPAIVTPPWYEVISPASSGDSPPSDASLSLYVPQFMPQLTSPQDRALLNHYSTIVSPLLSRRSSTSTNPYINYLLPMAHQNETVLHCILALSGNHWRKMQPNMGNRGLIHQSQATTALARLLPHVDRTSADIALVCSLLLCMTELFDGTSEGWQLHLKGAKRLLAALRQQHGDLWTGHYKFLLRLSRFLDSAATVSTCRPPLMEEEAREAAAIEGLTATPDEDDSAVYGIPKELFHLVDQINSLADKRKMRVDATSEALFRQEAAQVEDRINHWSYEYGGLSQAVNALSPTDDDAVHATMAFEHALRLRLHQIVEGYALNDPKVTQTVDGIVYSVQKIRYGSPLEPCLLFPLVMAGGACWKLEHRAVIQDRLMVMERTCGFGYVYNARDLVERVWSRRDSTEGTGAIVNWARIRYEEMHGLVVF
jgi:transcriptional activator protein UGA3